MDELWQLFIIKWRILLRSIKTFRLSSSQPFPSIELKLLNCEVKEEVWLQEKMCGSRNFFVIQFFVHCHFVSFIFSTQFLLEAHEIVKLELNAEKTFSLTFHLFLFFSFNFSTQQFLKNFWTSCRESFHFYSWLVTDLINW